MPQSLKNSERVPPPLSMSPHMLLLHWSIRLALVCYAASVACRLVGWPNWRLTRRLWTAGCLCFLLHLLAAFQFVHHWSHLDALADTARRTGQLLGWAFGEGIFFSYGFALLWTLDVAWWWCQPASYLARPRWLSLGVDAYLFFIAFNGAVIFEDGWTRWLGIPVTLGLAWLAARRLRLDGRPDGRPVAAPVGSATQPAARTSRPLRPEQPPS